MKKIILLTLFGLVIIANPAYSKECSTSLNTKGGHKEVCFCHNVNHNPHTICTDNEGLINGHMKHVNKGDDYLGECVAPPKECDDKDPCTKDYLEGDECVYEPIDSDECNPPPVCEDDGDECTKDTFVDGICSHIPIDSEACNPPPVCEDDGDACTKEEFIDEVCTHIPLQTPECLPPPNCEDNDVCTIETVVDNKCVYTSNPGCEPKDPVCGNGIIEENEACDDGNTVPQDGCSASCQIDNPPVEPVCGNGIVEEGEECDGGSSCDEACKIIIVVPPVEPPTEGPTDQEPVPVAEEPCTDFKPASPVAPVTDILEGSGNGCAMSGASVANVFSFVGFISLFAMIAVKRRLKG